METAILKATNKRTNKRLWWEIVLEENKITLRKYVTKRTWFLICGSQFRVNPIQLIMSR